MAHTEVDKETILVWDTVLELEHNPSLSPKEAVKLAEKYPGRWWNGRNGKPISVSEQD